MSESQWDESIVLDRAHLSGFTGGDPDFEIEVLSVFLEHGPSYLMELTSTDSDGWRSLAHKLKGAARSIGAWRLARAAERAEHMGALATDDPRRKGILKELDARVQELCGEIRTAIRDLDDF